MHNKPALEPVLSIALFRHVLQAINANRQQSDAKPVDVAAVRLLIWRITSQSVHQKRRCDSECFDRERLRRAAEKRRNTHPISSCVAPRLPAIWGSATLTTVVSSTSMIAAVISPAGMNQR